MPRRRATFGKDTIKQKGVVTGFDIRCIKTEKISEEVNKEMWGIIINIDLEDGRKVDCMWEINQFNATKISDNKRVYGNPRNMTSVPFVLGSCGVDSISKLIGTTVRVAMDDRAVRVCPNEDCEREVSYWLFATKFEVH